MGGNWTGGKKSNLGKMTSLCFALPSRFHDQAGYVHRACFSLHASQTCSTHQWRDAVLLDHKYGTHDAFGDARSVKHAIPATAKTTQLFATKCHTYSKLCPSKFNTQSLQTSQPCLCDPTQVKNQGLFVSDIEYRSYTGAPGRCP